MDGQVDVSQLHLVHHILVWDKPIALTHNRMVGLFVNGALINAFKQPVQH